MSASLAPIGRAASQPQQLARAVVKNPRLLDKVIAGIEAQPAPIKFGCDKALRLLSETHPDLLYPQFDFFVHLLDHPNKIFQWEAAHVLSQLVRVDSGDKFAAVFDRYFAPIAGPVMITAANLIRGGARMARAKPQLADRIADQVLQVERAQYRTPECRNVAIGHAIAALGEFFELLQNQGPALRFIRKQLNNPRPATRKKAELFLKRL